MSIKERLQKYCTEKKTTIGTFCRYAGISGSYFNQVKNDIGKDIQARIAKNYDDLNIEWLRTGEGEMLKYKSPSVQPATMSPYPVEDAQIIGEQSNIPQSSEVAVEQPPIIPDSIARKPDIDLLAWAENNANEHSQNAFDIIEIMKKTAFIVKTTNNAMASALYQNEFVFLKPMPDNALITDGDPYGIDTNNRGILIRYLYDKGDYYLARPKNRKEYGDIEIPKENVIRKYIILFHGSTLLSSASNNDIDLAHRDKQITQQSAQISSLIEQLGESMKEISKSGTRQDKLIEMIEKKL